MLYVTPNQGTDNRGKWKADDFDTDEKKANSACSNQSIVVVSCGVQGFLTHRPDDVLDTIADLAKVATESESFSDQMICRYTSMRYEPAQTHERCRSFAEKDVKATVERIRLNVYGGTKPVTLSRSISRDQDTADEIDKILLANEAAISPKRPSESRRYISLQGNMHPQGMVLSMGHGSSLQTLIRL